MNDGPVDKYLRFNKSGRRAYQAYVKEVGGTTFDSKPIPQWEEIQPRQRNGWRAAVKAVLEVTGQ